MTNEEAAALIEWYETTSGKWDGSLGEAHSVAIAALRSPATGAADLLKRWQDAALDHYTPGWAFDPTNPELMIGNIAREALPAPGAEAMREAAARVAWCAVPEFMEDGRPPTSADFSNQIAEEIRALPIPAPEVPEEVRRYVEEFDASGDDAFRGGWVAAISNLRDWIRKEWNV